MNLWSFNPGPDPFDRERLEGGDGREIPPMMMANVRERSARFRRGACQALSCGQAVSGPSAFIK